MHKPKRQRPRAGKKRRSLPPVSSVSNVFHWIAMVNHCGRTKCLRSIRCQDPKRRCFWDNRKAVRVMLARAAVRKGEIPPEALEGYDGSQPWPVAQSEQYTPRSRR